MADSVSTFLDGEEDMERLFAFQGIDICTPTLDRFLSEHASTIGSYFFLAFIATRLDIIQEIATEALSDTESSKTSSAPSTKTMMKYYSETNSRNLLTNTADNLLCYISEILQAVVRQKPEILRSSERVTTEEVLQFTRYDDLIAFIADRKINELAYGGLRGMSAFISEKLGVEMFENEQQRMLVTILVELRNVHTHNRGVINQLFLNRMGVPAFEEFSFVHGQFFHVDMDRFSKLAKAAVEVATRLDMLLASKFALKRGERRVATDLAGILGLPPTKEMGQA